MKKLYLIILLIMPFSLLNSQELKLQSFGLSDIKFKISITGIPDSLNHIDLEFEKNNRIIAHNFLVNNSEVDTSIQLSEYGSYSIKNVSGQTIGHIRIIPGWLSILPPLLAILLALLMKQVLTALAAGIYAGAFFIYDYNPFAAMLRLVDTFIINALVDRDHMFILVFTLLIGGVVGIISRNGGTTGLANQITRFAKTAKSGMISSWLLGILIFFDDYANSLIIGNMMRPITDRLKISREKLAYIVDSTAAPVASVVLISTWIGYEVGLIEDGLRSIGSSANAYDIFISTIPYSFYPIAAIFFVFLTSYLGRDFGPMYKAEVRARQTGKVSSDNYEAKELKDNDKRLYKGKNARWINGAVPILIILLGTISGLYFTGVNALLDKGITNYSIQDIINSSDSYSSLLWSSFFACLIAIIMSVTQKILSIDEALRAWQKGVQSMMVAVIILVFAWAISSVTNQMYTADYLISIISDSMDPRLLPLIVFLVCALTGFSTGTSWGTMAIVMPIVIPLTHKLASVSGLPQQEYTIVLLGVISAVLAGSVFGDHCSPIADTTILSSLASKCNHIDHVNTQLPYALIVGFTCMLLGYVPSAYGLNPFLSILLIFIALTGFLLIFGKKQPEIKTN
ncbi:MAG: sodium:proton antiporter [Ignavibacteriae bacterium HGW-Ignavibacteriae-2]|nr:MAG: sodium:proton antiporter [Ignavibacteriae bacterium HGW-Ignavibacteriae-2]